MLSTIFNVFFSLQNNFLFTHFNVFVFFHELFFSLSLRSFSFPLHLNRGNTEGWRCERCKAGYWGDPTVECELCRCHNDGSDHNVCNSSTGQCVCKKRYTGHRCDECEVLLTANHFIIPTITNGIFIFYAIYSHILI